MQFAWRKGQDNENVCVRGRGRGRKREERERGRTHTHTHTHTRKEEGREGERERENTHTHTHTHTWFLIKNKSVRVRERARKRERERENTHTHTHPSIHPHQHLWHTHTHIDWRDACFISSIRSRGGMCATTSETDWEKKKRIGEKAREGEIRKGVKWEGVCPSPSPSPPSFWWKRERKGGREGLGKREGGRACDSITAFPYLAYIYDQ